MKEVSHYWMAWCLPRAKMLCRLKGGSATTHLKGELAKVNCENCLKKYSFKPLKGK